MRTSTLFSVLAIYMGLTYSQDVKRTDLANTGYSKDTSEIPAGQSERNYYELIDSRQLTDCQNAGEGTPCVYKTRLPGQGICCHEGVTGEFLWCPSQSQIWTAGDCGSGKVCATVDSTQQQIQCGFIIGR